MCNIDSILQIQIENKAHYLKTKILSTKTYDEERQHSFAVCRARKSKNFGHRRKPKLATFCRRIPNRFRILISFWAPGMMDTDADEKYR